MHVGCVLLGQCHHFLGAGSSQHDPTRAFDHSIGHGTPFLRAEYVGDLGETLAPLIEIYLAGRVTLAGAQVVDEARFPGPMGRALLAVLALDRGPVARGRLADVLWDGEPPDAFNTSLNPLVSKLRRLFQEAGADPSTLTATGGAVELRRLTGVWIDIEEATRALDAAEGALRRGSPEEAWPKAAVATSVFRRPFLEGVDLIWAEAWRRELKERLIRGLEVATDVWILRADPKQAVVAARQLLNADRYRETSHRRLIRGHLMAGNRAAALRAYSQCEEVLREELGVEPSPLVQEVYEEALSYK